MTTVTELVPASVLLGIAQRIRNAAFRIAKSKNVPMRSVGEIVIDIPKVTQAQVAINIRLSNDRIAAFEWGSGVHRKRGTPAKYIVTPKHAKSLVFPGTNAWAGQTIITKRVEHPGVKAKPFLEPAKQQTRQQNLTDLRAAVSTNIRLIVKGMARKI